VSRRRPALLAATAAVALAGCGGHSETVSLTARAPSGLADAPLTLAVRGLDPHARVTLRARWSAYGGHVWTGSLPARASAGGTVGIDGTRLLSGLRPLGAAFRHPFFVAPPGRAA
jgi:hypothetical protein